MGFGVSLVGPGVVGLLSAEVDAECLFVEVSDKGVGEAHGVYEMAGGGEGCEGVEIHGSALFGDEAGIGGVGEGEGVVEGR